MSVLLNYFSIIARHYNHVLCEAVSPPSVSENAHNS